MAGFVNWKNVKLRLGETELCTGLKSLDLSGFPITSQPECYKPDAEGVMKNFSKRIEPSSHLFHGHKYVPSHQTNVRETWRLTQERIANAPKLPAPQRGNADIALLVFAAVCAVWLVVASLKGWLPGGGL